MQYLVTNAFNKLGIDGEFNLSIGTEVQESNNIIYYDNKRICYVTSQNAYDHFSRNNDGKASQRYETICYIKGKIAEYVAEFNEEIAAINNGDLSEEQKEAELANIIDKSTAAYNAIRNYKSDVLKPNDNIFNYNFYNATITVLNHIKSLVNNI